MASVRLRYDDHLASSPTNIKYSNNMHTINIIDDTLASSPLILHPSPASLSPPPHPLRNSSSNGALETLTPSSSSSSLASMVDSPVHRSLSSSSRSASHDTLSVSSSAVHLLNMFEEDERNELMRQLDLFHQPSMHGSSISKSNSENNLEGTGKSSSSSHHHSKTKRHMKSAAQLRILRTYYVRESSRPSKESIVKLSYLLGIPTTELTRWFRNERFKRKKKAKKNVSNNDAMEEEEVDERDDAIDEGSLSDEHRSVSAPSSPKKRSSPSSEEENDQHDHNNGSNKRRKASNDHRHSESSMMTTSERSSSPSNHKQHHPASGTAINADKISSSSDDQSNNNNNPTPIQGSLPLACSSSSNADPLLVDSLCNLFASQPALLQAVASRLNYHIQHT